MKAIFKRLILVSLMSLGLVKVTANEVKEVKAETTYTFTKVEENLSDWTGEYLIVYETGSLAFNGALTTLDAKNNCKEVVIDGKSIVADGTFSFFIEKNGEGYSIKSASGYYIFNSSNKNALKSSTSIPSNNNSISYIQSYVDVIAASSHLRFNPASDQMRFRYYKSDTYTDQKAIQLYKKEVVFADYTATLHYNDDTTPDGSITSVEGKFTAPETPTRTGYVFDGWYTDDVFENLFDFENTFATENIDLYAKWVDEKDTYLQTTSFALGFDYAFSGGNEVTSLEQLVSGNTYYLCASLESTNVATNTLDSGKLTTVNSLSEGTAYKFVNNGSTWDIIDPLTNNYLFYAGDGPDLKLENTPTDSWTIEYLDGEFSIKSNSVQSREILYRAGTSNVFGGYASSNISNHEYSRIKLFSEASYSFSNYALRFGTEITTENYAKLGEVKSYGVLVAPTKNLGDVTFKDLCSTAAELSTLIELTEALNITNAKMQTTETGYSFGGLLKNIPETQIHTSVSAACYVVNAAGEIFFAEQKDMSIVGAATYYAEHAAELGLNETETTLVNVLKGM